MGQLTQDLGWSLGAVAGFTVLLIAACFAAVVWALINWAKNTPGARDDSLGGRIRRHMRQIGYGEKYGDEDKWRS